MKTTIDFPEDLLHRAKLAAVQRKTTLKELVLQGVDYVITHSFPKPDSEAGRAGTLVATLSQGRVSPDEISVASAEHEEKERKAAMKRLLEAMKASNTEPMVPLKREEIYDR